jgi:hypothetical protein
MQSKWKMVSFRLSPEEYALVQGLWRSAGYRSISNFALSAMRAFVPAIESANESGTETSTLKRRLDKLEVRCLSESFHEHQNLCPIGRESVSPEARFGAAGSGSVRS